MATMADMRHLDYRGRRLRLAWEEARKRLDREDDPLPDLEDAERDAWDEWEHWASDAGLCVWCGGEITEWCSPQHCAQ